MKFGKIAFLALAGCIVLSLVGCGSSEGAVFVQPVADLAAQSGLISGERFGGMVVSENVSEIQKDAERTVETLSVREGDDVEKGDPLFSYDIDELQLNLDKLILQKEQLEASIESSKAKIRELELERDRSGGHQRLEYILEIQTTQVDLKEAELKLKTKNTEVEKARDLVKHATVVAPVAGRIQTINETGTDSNGKPLPYITIQQVGSYRVKGVLNELQRGTLMEGDRVRLESRVDSSVCWYGTVALVDYANPSAGGGNTTGMESDEMTSSSKYPFYVDLDSSDGMILGQHLYLLPDTGEGEEAGIHLSSAFICFEDNGDPFVWAASRRNKLEKRVVTLGDYNEIRDSYVILSGLTEKDAIAFPDEELCRPGAPVTYTAAQTEGGM